jgi:hypothetical protein
VFRVCVFGPGPKPPTTAELWGGSAIRWSLRVKTTEHCQNLDGRKPTAEWSMRFRHLARAAGLAHFGNVRVNPHWFTGEGHHKAVG